MNAQIQFINVWVLYLLWLVPLVAWWWYASARQLEKRLQNFLSFEMQKKLRPPASRIRQAWQTGLITAGIFLVLVAAARPQWGTREEIVYQRGKDVVIALDVSRSMLANDIYPNRLMRAKTDILDLIKELRGDRAALIAFRKKAVTLCPLTTDYAYLNQALEAISIDAAPAGETDIGDVIYKAMETLKNDEGSHKAIILISDGEDLRGKALAAAEAAGKKNIPIFTVGLGSSGGSKIPDPGQNQPYFRHKGQEVVSKLNNTNMQAIAEATGGAYIPVGTASMTSTTLGMLYRNHLSRLSAKDFEETLQRRHVERFQWFLLPAFLLLLAGAFLSRGRLASSSRKQETPPPLKNIAVLLLFILPAFVTDSAAQATNYADQQAEQMQSPAPTNALAAGLKIPEGREGARVAQKLYLLGKYEEASKAYLEAARTAPAQSQYDFRYNAAVALFKAGKYRESAEILKDVQLLHKEKQGQNTVATGLGAALYRAAELPKQPDSSRLIESAKLLRESGESFKEAARAKPGDNQAKKNLAVVLEALPAADEQAKTAELMAKYEKTPPQQIADQMLQAQRQIITETPPAFTNDSPAQIRTLELIAEKQKANADLWIPLKGKLLNSMAQQQGNDPKIQQQVAAFDQLADGTRTQMKNAADAFRDLDTAGYNPAVVAENAVYQFWKSIAYYQGILQEDIRRQTNTITISSAATGELQQKRAKAEQDEASNLTDIFKKRFSETVPESGEPPKTAPQPKGNEKSQGEKKTPEEQQGISAETRRRILELAGQAATTQKSASELIAKKDLPSSITEQRKAHDLLKEIEKLLPKNKQDQKQEKKDQEQEKKDKQQQQQDQQNKDQQQKQQDQQQQQQQNDQDKKEPPEQKEDKQEKKNKDELTADQLKKLLEKATQRENEHEEQKRERNRNIPLTPIDRDW